MTDGKTRHATPLSATRRRFLAGAGGLTLGTFVSFGGSGRLARAAAEADGAAAPFAPNAFVRIAPDNTVTVLIKHIEFGQGPYTGLATLVAEELDADWSQMRAEAAPSDVALYANTLFGVQGTGGSTAIANSYMQMRKAGAAARAMLVAAAAKNWDAPAGEIEVADGVVRHRPSGASATFGELTALAAQETPPEDPPVKDRADFKLIGRELPKLDTRAKSTGAAVFTLDLYRENMLTALVAHPPKFGATPGAVDAKAALATPGVVAVETIPQGVAVLAESTYAAMQGRDALSVEWNETAAETRSTKELYELFHATAGAPGVIAAERGDVQAAAAPEAGAQTAFSVEADYYFPYLAHAPMEPLDALIEEKDGVVDAWLGAQIQTADHQTIAGVLGLGPEKVRIHTMLSGGSFGRRAQPKSEFAAEAAAVFRAAGRKRPVKLMWTREDDIRGGFYRPLTVHRLKAGMDANGALTFWDQTIASQSFMVGDTFEGSVEGGVDTTMVEGARDLYYATPNLRVSAHAVPAGVPTLWWRSVGHTHTAYAVETMIDELLQKAGRDAVEGRLALLEGRAREANVLTRVAELADWGRAPRRGAAFGVAVHKSFGTYVAQIAEVSMEDGAPVVHKVWAAVDCGQPVNLNVIKAQVEGGVGYGLGAALFDEIILDEGGTVRQSNFHDYRSIRMPEMPAVEVAIIDSAEPPTGIGEPGVPPIAPAVGNAIRRLTGVAPRRLPFVPTDA